MTTMSIKSYEILDSFQDFLLNNTDFEAFLQTKGFTNQESTSSLKQMSYIHYPKQQTAINTFPFISFESTESADTRREEDGFRWYIDIVIGLEDINESNPNHQLIKDGNILKYTKTRDAQDFGTFILETIERELRYSGIKADFDIEFGKIQQSTTPTGEFDVIYHLVELELISYKDI